MSQQKLCVALLIFSLLNLVGCSTKFFSSPDPRKYAEQIASQAGFVPSRIATKSFTLTTYEKKPAVSTSAAVNSTAVNSTSTKTLVVYIEGDGHSWSSRNTISPDPTPHNPLALKLAALDPRPNVVYLARPCQYTPVSSDPACHPDVWTSHRFSEPVITAMNEAVEQLKRKTGAKEIQLVGFSGGAAIAVFIAARRHDVVNLKTVAGDLDHESMTAYHQTTPLTNALNPKQFASKIAHIPQHHYVGAEDTVVPTFIADPLLQKVAETYPNNAKKTVLPKVSHHQGWVKVWQSLLQ